MIIKATESKDLLQCQTRRNVTSNGEAPEKDCALPLRYFDLYNFVG